MDLNLLINEMNLQPGAKIDSGLLENNNFSKTGLVKRLVSRLPRGHNLFEAENCTVDCFGERLSLFPCTHSYLNKDRQWETRASLLVVDDHMQRISFQVVDGVYAAPNLVATFKNICNEFFGESHKLGKNHFTWKNNNLSFSCLLHADLVNAEFSIECIK